MEDLCPLLEHFAKQDNVSHLVVVQSLSTHEGRFRRMRGREADGSLAIVVHSKGFNQHAKIEVFASLVLMHSKVT